MKLRLILGSLVAALALGSTASAVTITSSALIGGWSPASSYNNDTQATQAADALVRWFNGESAASTVDLLDNANFWLSGNDFGATLPTPVTFVLKDDGAPFESIDADSYTYVLGKYGNDAYVFYLGIYDGVVDLPAEFGFGENKVLGLSHYVLFNAITPPPPSVPDGGVTLLFLGSAFAGLAIFSRRQRA